MLKPIARRLGIKRPRRRPIRPATEVFSDWAAAGRDLGMEKNHAAAVGELLAAALAELGRPPEWTAIDAGCGNGWVVRRLRDTHGCRSATGVDGSAGMIQKARAVDPTGDYALADLMTWQPADRADLVVSMEVLYYFPDPLALLTRIARTWLKPDGVAVFGIDHYMENESSLSWPDDVGVRMTTWPEARWQSALDEAGFARIRTWRAAVHPGHAGTLAMLVRAPRP